MFFVGEANKPMSVAAWMRQDPYTCSEYITSRTGQMIMKDDYPVKGQRMDRYDSNTDGQMSVMIPIKK